MLDLTQKTPLGNSYAEVIETSIACIVNLEPAVWYYDPDIFPPMLVKMAVDRLESARNRALKAKPVADAKRAVELFA